jgi:UDP-2,3-diacylglucosamine pyrophosphatase LpxH
LEEDLPSQQAMKTSRSSNTYLRQSRLQTYIDQQDKEGHSILIKGEVHRKAITIINLYVPNVNATNFVKHTLKDIKAYIDSNTLVVGDFITPLSPTDRSSKQKKSIKNF